MLIYGHAWIDGPKFVKVFSLDDISKCTNEDVLLLEPLNVSIDLAKHCRDNSLSFAVTVNTLKEAIFANALGADFILAQYEQAIDIQKIADEYLFESKILVLVNSEREIETMAHFAIDGVIFPQAIIQVSQLKD
jgi:hypothetical protein